MKWFLMITLLLMAANTSPAFAQFSTDLLGQNLNIILDPQYPSPGETVTATLDDYALGIAGASINWNLDGQTLADQTNSRQITFTAGAVGTNQLLKVIIRSTNGQSLEAVRRITPLYTDVIIEPQTYTPLFYQGRALPSFGSPVILTAIIHDENGPIDAASHTYSWYLNNEALGGGPIRGGHKTRMVVPYGRYSVVTLSVADSRGTTIARKLIEVPSVELDVQFYEISTLFGQSERVVGDSLNILANSTTIRAVPYYLDKTVGSSQIFTEWEIDRETPAAGPDPFQITLLRQGGGTSKASFKVRNLSALIQSDQETFSIHY